MQLKHCFLVMVDISGYTRFMTFHATSLLHAEAIVTELLEAVLDQADYPLTIAKLEGDAVFLYAELRPGEEVAAAHDITRQIGAMFNSFYAKERAFLDCRHGCACDACARIGQLKLKEILHFGNVTFKQIRQFTELVGADVLLIHRLLKNSIPTNEYILMSESFHALAGDYADQQPEFRTEQVEDLGAIPILVYYPGIQIKPEQIPSVSGTDLAAVLNKHSFARMLRRKPRGEFNNLAAPKMNLILYLLEGIASGIKVLRQQFERRPKAQG
jgi:hypothetical protein